MLSRQYVRPAYGAKGAGVNLGVMFLCEAALGKEASITTDDWKLTKPPQVCLLLLVDNVDRPIAVHILCRTEIALGVGTGVQSLSFRLTH